MEFLVIVLFVVAIVVVNLVVSRAQRRRKQAAGESPDAGGANGQRTAKAQRPPRSGGAGAKAAAAGPRTSVEAAREANARLDAVQHQQVYAAIAQGHPVKALKLYAQFTGTGIRAAGAAVENLAVHPQPFQPPRPVSDAPAAADGAAPAAPAASSTDKPVPSEPAAGASAAPAADVFPAAAASKDAAPEDAAPEDAADAAGKPDPQMKSAKDDAAGKAPEGEALPRGGSAPADKSRRGPAAAAPATPEEEEISNWVKNLRPEDF